MNRANAIQHHPSAEWLVDYVAGKLDETYRMVLAAHIENCVQCRHSVVQMQNIGASYMANLVPTALADDAFKQTLAKAQANTGNALNTPRASAATLSVHERLLRRAQSQKGWLWRGRGLRVMPVLKTPQAELTLLHIGAGAAVPAHSHHGQEMTMVLKGAISDQYGRYQCADLMLMDGEHDHAPVASSDGDCLCLIAQSDALRFTGPLLRWINPFLH